MNSLNIAVVLAAVIVCSNASGLGLGLGLVGLNPAAQIPSGSVSVGVNGAVVAGPSGSVRTDNGLAGLGAGAQLSGPAGDVRTRGGAVALDGPGVGLKGIGIGIAPTVVAARTVLAAPVVANVGLGLGLGGIGGAVVAPAGLGIGVNGLGVGLGGLGGLGLGKLGGW